ncbi:hypothetical protein CLU81_0514 [Flavobacterium sp. 9]|nr:hypothetical protein CLU81_0514 [Flavobacterium sp. 9]
MKKRRVDGDSLKNKNIVVHLVIRVAIFLVISVYLLSMQKKLYSHDKLFIFMELISFAVLWVFFLMIETIVLNRKKRRVLKNANLLLISITPFLLFICIYVFDIKQ